MYCKPNKYSVKKKKQGKAHEHVPHKPWQFPAHFTYKKSISHTEHQTPQRANQSSWNLKMSNWKPDYDPNMN